MATPVTREQALELDRCDPLAAARDAFALPDGVIYLDGNSLGPPPASVASRLQDVVGEQWGSGLIRSWTSHDWIGLPQRVGAAIAPLVGARRDEIVVADSVTVNLFKLLGAALRLRAERRVVLSERENFGTDLYVAQGLADLLDNGTELRTVDRRHLESALDDGVAVVMLTHIDFRSGEMHDMVRWTSAAHATGALIVWDLAHSAGAVPVDLDGCGADFAVGCGYKYLNGGPGAPAFAFVARRHHAALRSPLWGWMGHAAPFDFETGYRPAPGVGQLKVGTPPILSLAALECGVESVAAIGIGRLREKSIALCQSFIALVERECADHGFELASPRDAGRRGSQVALRHPEGYAIVQALIEEGVIGDFRAPDLLRFGFAPAYVRFVDVWDAVAGLRKVMEDGLWDCPRFRTRSVVT